MKTVLSVLFFFLGGSLYCTSQAPSLNSLSSARATIYLDFDGQYVSGTSWNWSGDINAQPSGLSASAITEIFNRVSEDYRIFDVNVTTDSTAFLSAPPFQRIRVIITPTSGWYGAPVGGVSFIQSFTWGDDTPAFVFNQLLSNNLKYISEACSHETGHTLGLQHQSTYNSSCLKTAEYEGGKGSGEIGWAPIMGVGYFKNLTTWHNGKSALGCSSIQSDIDLILSGNGFGLRVDDYADVINQAADLPLEGTSFNASGIINSAEDRDVFSIVLPTQLDFRLVASPENVGSANAGADLDLRVYLLNQSADTIGKYDPLELLNAGVDTVLNAGKYFLVVEGIGNINLSDYGSLGHYILAGSLNMALPVHNLKLKGKVASNYHVLSWTMQAEEPIKEFELQFSSNGTSFEKLVTLGPSQSDAVYLPTINKKIFYRVKAITRALEIAYYSNVVSLPPGPKYHIVRVENPIVNNRIRLISGADCSYQLIMSNGQRLGAGKIKKGVNNIEVQANAKGLYLLRITYVNEVWTEKIIKQ
jgi:hypothetical protein